MTGSESTYEDAQCGRIRLLIIGQTPPPFGGQAIMIQALVEADLPGIEKRHVRLAYSKEMLEMGRPQLRKAFHLLGVILRVWWQQLTFRPDVVYYPPGGADKWPVVRDCVTLLAIRPFTRRLLLHIHAGGVSGVWERGIGSAPARALFRRAFFGADAAVVLSRSNPPDGQILEARRTYYVTNGIADVSNRVPSPAADGDRDGELTVLFVGVLLESKGVIELAQACAEVWRRGHAFEVCYVGQYSPEIADRLEGITADHADRLHLKGVLTGDRKWQEYARADIFCFPSFFSAEAVSLVLLEAMMFSLPVIATRWRGNSETVVDGVTGYLVECHDVRNLARRLEELVDSRDLRVRLGEAGRRRFEEEYSVATFIERMGAVVRDVMGQRSTTADDLR
jgi:glycosyltransferase involved in cell wall biosynthesis